MNQLRAQWMEHHPDINPLEKSNAAADAPYVAPGDMPIELDIAYKVEVKCATVHKNNFGDKQLMLKLRVLTDTDEVQVGSHTEFMTLPFQQSDMQVADQEMVRKRHMRRVQDITRIFSACEPDRFALYERKEGDTFYGFDGQPMDKEAFKERERSCGDSTLDMVDHIHSLRTNDPIDVLGGTRLYVRRVPNDKKPRYPFTNWYAKRPQATRGNPPIEIFDGLGATEDIPF